MSSVTEAECPCDPAHITHTHAPYKICVNTHVQMFTACRTTYVHTCTGATLVLTGVKKPNWKHRWCIKRGYIVGNRLFLNHLQGMSD